MTTQLCFGRTTVPVRPLLLRAGPLTAWLEPETLTLRRICYGEIEVLRAIYGAVRDRNWGTIPVKLERFEIENQGDTFWVDFDATCSADEIDYSWHGRIEGDKKGTIQFRFEGLARSSFLANRIGLCVLHPIKGCAGQFCRIEHVNSHVETGVFPAFISPHQPFKNIRSVTHSVTEGVEATVRMDGDTFEMEDQRNWTDASYKTYSRPLELTFPFRVERNTRVQQLVTLTLTGTVSPSDIPATPFVELKITHQPPRRRPPLGLGFSSLIPISPLNCERLRALRLDHLRVDLHFCTNDWARELQAALDLLDELPACRLHCALFLSDAPEPELRSYATQLRSFLGSRNPEDVIALWLIYPENGPATPDTTVKSAVHFLRNLSREIPIAAGTDANFAELNRNRPSTEVMPCFSCNPQVHTKDDLTLFENLEALPDTVVTARQFSSKPIVISTITLRPRFNADATAPGAISNPEQSQPKADPRQTSLLGAAWALGTLDRVGTLESVNSLTYFQIAGPLGIMTNENETASAEDLPYTLPAVFPVYHLFAWLAELPMIAPVTVTDPLRIAAITLYDEAANVRVLIANLTADPQVVRLHAPFESASWKIIDEGSVVFATTDPEEFRSRQGQKTAVGSHGFMLELAPYSIGLLSGDRS